MIQITKKKKMILLIISLIAIIAVGVTVDFEFDISPVTKIFKNSCNHCNSKNLIKNPNFDLGKEIEPDYICQDCNKKTWSWSPPCY